MQPIHLTTSEGLTVVSCGCSLPYCGRSVLHARTHTAAKPPADTSWASTTTPDDPPPPQRPNGIDEPVDECAPATPEDVELSRVLSFIDVMPTWERPYVTAVKVWLMQQLSGLAHRR